MSDVDLAGELRRLREEVDDCIVLATATDEQEMQESILLDLTEHLRRIHVRTSAGWCL